MKALELVKGQAQAAELYEERRENLSVVFHGGDLEKVAGESVVGQALRVIARGKLGFASTAGGGAEGLVQAALAAASHGDPAPFQFPVLKPGQAVPVYDPDVLGLTAEELIRWGEQAIHTIRQEFPEVVVETAVSRGTAEVTVANTEGGERRERRTYVSMWVSAEQIRPGDIWMVGASQVVRRASDLRWEELAQKILTYLRWGRTLAPAPNGKPPVLFAPSGTTVLFLPLMVGFSGMSVFLGTSPLKGKLGEEVFGRRLNLVDDGTLPFGPRSRSFDDEGLASGRMPLVENGVVRNFFYDLRAAALAKADSTGNGLKGSPMGGGGFRVPPGPAPRNLCLQPGEGTLEELIRDLKEGLIVVDVLGLGQGNIQSGAFSNNVGVGFAVKDGRVVGRVKNTMIAGNAYEVLKGGLRAVGGVPDWVGGSLYTPPVLVEGVTVVGG